MSPDPDDEFALQLAVLDGQVAAGDLTNASSVLTDTYVLSDRLDGALACLQALERVWPRTAETPVLATPRTLGRFTLVRELGRGGFGIVYLAEDRQLGRDVALKVQRPEAIVSPDARKRFLREARAAAALSHPNIVATYDSGEDSLWCWIAAELVRGPSLAQYLAQNAQKRGQAPFATKTPQNEPVPFAEPVPGRPTIDVSAACRLVLALADAMAYAHLHKILHRDLKPSNVLLEPRRSRPSLTSGARSQSSPGTLDDYTPKLTDFGLAKQLDSGEGETRTGARLGTPAYMPPEQIEGKKSAIGPATDVYGLGVLLYELLAGRAPFAAESETGIIKQVLLEEVPPLRKQRKEVPRDLDAIVLRALEKSPDRRYATAADLATDLRRFLAGESTAARPQTLPQKLAKKIRRHPGVTMALLASALAIGFWYESNQLAQKNHDLLGLRMVSITTEPPGARIAFAPINEATGEPDPAKVIRPQHKSPVIAELAPGEYLVVAELADGRFHEVYRSVPVGMNGMSHQGEKHHWSLLADGTIQLHSIKIPPAKVTDGMARVTDVGEVAVNRSSGKPTSAAFFMDCHEFTVGDYRRVQDEPTGPISFPESSPEAAMTQVNYDWAASLAENFGKRLPTEREVELAMRHCAVIAADAGSDRTDTDPPIYGLLSGVAEWTSTANTNMNTDVRLQNVSIDGILVSKIVRAADPATIDNPPPASETCRDPRLRTREPRGVCKPGLGFRCVRSAEPQF